MTASGRKPCLFGKIFRSFAAIAISFIRSSETYWYYQSTISPWKCMGLTLSRLLHRIFKSSLNTSAILRKTMFRTKKKWENVSIQYNNFLAHSLICTRNLYCIPQTQWNLLLEPEFNPLRNYRETGTVRSTKGGW